MPTKLIFTSFQFFYLLSLCFGAFAQIQPTNGLERQNSLANKRLMATNSPFKTAFRNIGPSVMSGRVVDIAVNPADPTEFYVAYATGGLWHTTNNGQSFTPIFDQEDVIFLGAVAVHWPSRTIWVGTGEANSSRSSYSGIGVYKSSNNGASWRYLGLQESHHIAKIAVHPTDTAIAWVAVLGHLYSPNKERGVFKTTDGGKSWKHTLAVDAFTGAVDVVVNNSNPNEVYASMWYKMRSASNFEESGKTSGIYKSTDGGSRWQQLNTNNNGLPSNEGIGRIGIALFPKNPSIVYAIIDNQNHHPDTVGKKEDTLSYQKNDLKDLTVAQFSALNDKKIDTFLRRNRAPSKLNAADIKKRVASGSLLPNALYNYFSDANLALFNTPVIGAEVYRSDDAGKTWRKTNEKHLPNLYNSYGYYFGSISVSPTNENKIVVMGVSIERSIDGGKTFTDMDQPNVHSDHHICWMNPARDNHMINGNDGGINITYDDGAHWYKANSPAVSQFYAVTTDNARPYKVYGGLQDNGVWTGFTRKQRTSDANYDTLQYRALNGGDGMMVQVDYRDNKTVYSGSQFGNYSRQHLDSNTQQRITPQHELGEMPYRFNWLTPILLSRHQQDIIYMGSQYFHRSLSKGNDMKTLSADLTNGKKEGDVPFGTITTIAESPLRFGVLYLGTDDGNVQLSKDGGNTWTMISTSLKNVKGLWVSRVEASKYKEGRVYATFNGYRNDHLTAYIFVSEDFGASWKSISNNLPLEPVNVVREDPKKEGILYVGTDGGLYVSKDAGLNWQIWKAGLPHSIPVHDIAIQERENEIILGTHGRSLYVAALKELQQ